MSIRIVTDSASDIPEQLVKELQIEVVPLFIHIGDQSFRDGVDMTRSEFYQRLPQISPPPTTATPSMDTMRETYERLAKQGATHILSIHISAALSAVVNVAQLAAKETGVVPVTVLDGRQLSLGTGFSVLSAARAALEGHSLNDILAMVERQIKRTHVFAALDTLEYLRRSGRVNGVVSAMGSLLKIKPLMLMHDGTPSSEKIRTRKAAINRLVILLKERLPIEKAALVHSSARDRAEELLQQVRDLLPGGDIPIVEISPVIGAHTGPGVVGFVLVSNQR